MMKLNSISFLKLVEIGRFAAFKDMVVIPVKVQSGCIKPYLVEVIMSEIPEEGFVLEDDIHVEVSDNDGILSITGGPQEGGDLAFQVRFE